MGEDPQPHVGEFAVVKEGDFAYKSQSVYNESPKSGNDVKDVVDDTTVFEYPREYTTGHVKHGCLLCNR